MERSSSFAIQGASSASSFMSVTVTCAPCSARKRATATPVRASPTTSIFLLLSSISILRALFSDRTYRSDRTDPSDTQLVLPQFQGRDRHQRQDNGNDPEADDNLRLRHPFQLEVVVDRGH